MKLKHSYSKLFYTGTRLKFDNKKNKRIRILNTYTIVWINLILVLTFIEKIIQFLIVTLKGGFNDNYDTIAQNHLDYGSIVQWLTVVLFVTVILLNKINQFNIARILFLLVALSNFTLFTLFIKPGMYSEYFYVIIPPMALSIYIKNYVPFIVLVISLILFIAPYQIYPVYPQNIIDRFYQIPQVYIFISIYLLVNYFKKLNLKNEALLEIEKNKVLSDKIILENQQQELKKLNEFKSHFFVNLSHEIRTPLTLIKGHAAQINFNTAKNKSLESINIIKSQSEQIHSIINNIMDLGKIDENELQINIKSINVTEFLTHHYTNFKNVYETNNVQFLFENKITNLSFNVDEYLFSKSINNLLSNALKFSSHKGVVKLKAYIHNRQLIIEVSDNGIGIPEKDLQHIFDRFFQSKNHITQSQGSGIGLAFTKMVIDAHNFSIDVKSEPDINTIFTIKIPEIALQKAKVNAHIKQQKLNLGQQTLISSKRKILIVDDHTEMRAYLSSVLNNYKIVEAKNGKEALDILNSNSFDLIITDYMMPIMDGRTLVGNIKKLNIKTPIIILTARTDTKGKLNMLRLGIDAYLNKPFLKEELIMHIKQAFQSYDRLVQFNKELEKREKDNLDKFAEKFNQDLKNFIFKNMHTSNFGIDMIADHFKISKSTLNRKVKSLLGQVTKDIIMEARLQKARELLDENPLQTQKNIANAVGISNTSYFFKKMEKRFNKKVGN